MTDTKFPALEEVEGKIEDRRSKLSAVFDEAGNDIDLSKVKSISGDNTAKAEQIRAWNDELSDLGNQRDELKKVQQAAERVRQPGGNHGGSESGSESGEKASYANGSGQQQQKSVGDLFTESKAFKGSSAGESATLDVELKAVLDTSSGWEPETTRTGRLVPDPQRPVQITDLLPSTTTSQAAVVYMQEQPWTNQAAETAENSAYPEATLDVNEVSSTVRKISVFIPVTDEQLEDVTQVSGYLNNRLPFMIRQRLDGQILNGDGVAPNLEGILNVSGVQTQSKGTDPTPDAVYKAMVKARVNGRGMPDGVVFNPFDWQGVRLLRTSDGLYIWGNPSESGPDRIWGLNVSQSDALAQGTSLVGDFQTGSELATRRGIDTQVSNSHSDYFVNGKQAVRADMRVALVVYSPAMFCTVTGL